MVNVLTTVLTCLSMTEKELRAEKALARLDRDEARTEVGQLQKRYFDTANGLTTRMSELSVLLTPTFGTQPSVAAVEELSSGLAFGPILDVLRKLETARGKLIEAEKRADVFRTSTED